MGKNKKISLEGEITSEGRSERNGFCVWVPREVYEYVDKRADELRMSKMDYIRLALLRDKKAHELINEYVKF